MENSERDYKISSFNEKLKAVLIELAVNDQLPLDMTTLDASVFDSCTTPLVDALITLQGDAQWALEDKWIVDPMFFRAQIELVQNTLK